MDYLYTGAYLAAAFLFWVWLYKWLYKYFHRERFGEWDDSDRVFGVVWGGLVSLMWPLSLFCVGVVWAIVWAIKRLKPILLLLEKK